MDRNLALEAVRITESAALAAARHVGMGDEQAADEAAITAMSGAFNGLVIDGRVVIGEGEEANVPNLYIGQRLGNGSGPKLDIALDPLEGVTIAANGGYNALSVVAFAEEGAFLRVPDIYMDKIAVGGRNLPEDLVDLDASPAENLANVAKAKGVDVSDLQVCILDRPRHEELIGYVREAGAHVMLISDGDVSGVIATAMPESRIDMYMGWGGAPQGILAAAALRCLGGRMQGRLVVRSEEDRGKARRAEIADLSAKYGCDEMVKGPVMMAVTGVTDGVIVDGVQRTHGGAITYSWVMRSRTGTLRHIQSRHDFVRKACGGR
jgi:fructose-1,6-bisphosphatase II / sedoheptulose-1,7-bisphosphatase